MTEIQQWEPEQGRELSARMDPTGGRLVAWAEAARAAHTLAQSLVRTEIVPEHFRIKPNTPPAEVDRITGNATASLLLGDELGMSPLSALRNLYVIRGQVGMSARMQVALVLSRGHRMWVEKETDDTVVMAGHRAGDPDHIERVTWTIERAARAGFIRRGPSGAASNYDTQPRAMLYARAATELARRIAADVIAGIPETPAEEMGVPDAVEEAGKAVRITPRGHGRGPDATLPRGKGRGTNVGPAVREPTVTDPQPATVSNPDVSDSDSQGEPGSDSEPLVTDAQRALMHALFRALGWERVRYIPWVTALVGRKIDTTSDLTVTEGAHVIDALRSIDEKREPEQ